MEQNTVTYWTPGAIAGEDAEAVERVLKKILADSLPPDEVDALATHVLSSHLLVAKNSAGRPIGLCTFQVNLNSEPASLAVETLVDERPNGGGLEDLYGELLGLPVTFPEWAFLPAGDDVEHQHELLHRLENLGFMELHLHVGDLPIPYFHGKRPVF